MLVREFVVRIPPFAMFSLEAGALLPESTVELSIGPGRAADVVAWVRASFFLLGAGDAAGVTEDALTGGGGLTWRVLRDGSVLNLRLGGDGQLVVRAGSVQVAGDIIQALASHLGLVDLPAKAFIPAHMDALAGYVERVGAFNAVRQQLTAAMADQGSLVKSLVVRAEDARLLGDMEGVRDAYAQLRDVNRDLVASYRIRSSNHAELLACLRSVNQHIQLAGRLRVGRAEADLVAACRRALKGNDVPGLLQTIASGV